MRCPRRLRSGLVTSQHVLQQLLNRRRIVQHVDRPAARVEQLQARIDAEDVVDGGVNVAGRDGAGMRAIAEAISETGATSPKDMGRVMKAAMAKLAGQNVDGKAVNEAVRRKLSA